MCEKREEKNEHLRSRLWHQTLRWEAGVWACLGPTQGWLMRRAGAKWCPRPSPYKRQLMMLEKEVLLWFLCTVAAGPGEGNSCSLSRISEAFIKDMALTLNLEDKVFLRKASNFRRYLWFGYFSHFKSQSVGEKTCESFLKLRRRGCSNECKWPSLRPSSFLSFVNS